MFTMVDCDRALYAPPLDRRIVLKSALAMERLGARISPAFAGVLIVEARKETSAMIGKPQRSSVLRDLVGAPRGRLVTQGRGSKSRLAREQEHGLLAEKVLK